MMLQNRIALVTGAGSGIGQAIALAYAKEGATVLLLGRTQKKLEETYDRIKAFKGEASIVLLDLEKELHRIPQLVEGLHKRFGRLDILVNCAGLLGTMTTLEGYKPVEWEAVFRVNVTAPFFLTRELLPLLGAAPTASIINVSSSVAHQGRAFWGGYAASKAALANLTETWAGELTKTQIRINTVNPGGTATPMRATAFPGENPTTLPTPQEITPVFLYLASDESKDVRGQHLKARDWLKWQAEKPKQA
ncbi:MAG: YciK family oxidoreductase [Magnetococcales bacterium]|nr:YciK family oxidoreductase [Magnetococcales bacterium]